MMIQIRNGCFVWIILAWSWSRQSFLIWHAFLLARFPLYCQAGGKGAGGCGAWRERGAVGALQSEKGSG